MHDTAVIQYRVSYPLLKGVWKLCSRKFNKYIPELPALQWPCYPLLRSQPFCYWRIRPEKYKTNKFNEKMCFSEFVKGWRIANCRTRKIRKNFQESANSKILPKMQTQLKFYFSNLDELDVTVSLSITADDSHDISIVWGSGFVKIARILLSACMEDWL